MKRFLPLLLILLLLGCSSATPAPVNIPTAQDLFDEETKLYAVLLETIHPGHSIVLMEKSSVGPESSDAAAALQSVSSQFDSLDPETAASFIVRNAAPTIFTTEMDLVPDTTLMGEEDMRALFNINQDGWNMFYARHPQAPGITTLSLPGFNPAMNQALVAISTQSRWQTVSGWFVLLGKINSTWTIDQQVLAWDS